MVCDVKAAELGRMVKLSVGVILLLLLWFVPGVSAGGERDLLRAPQRKATLPGLPAGHCTGPGGPAFYSGFIPPPVDLSHLSGRVHRGVLSPLPLPVRYDLRQTGKITAVRDEGRCACSWAFAALGSLESNLRPAETCDFSENNLKNRHGFDLGPCSGGNALMAAAYLTRWDGPWDEADDPYDPFSSLSPPYDPVKIKKHVQQVLLIPDREDATDNDRIKEAVMGFGAVYTTMYLDDLYMNEPFASYYYGGDEPANRAVAIVGWDDLYDGSRFFPAAANDGAFIVKNSLGDGWGFGGYFVVSYDDAVIGTNNAVFVNGESPANLLRAYAYDRFGWVQGYGFSGLEEAWFANIYETSEDEAVAAAGFYAPSGDAQYELYVYSGAFDGTSPVVGPPLAVQSGSLGFAGFHTILLNQPVALPAGSRFSIVVKLSTPGYQFPIAAEVMVPDYTSRAQPIGAGLSWVSGDGATWTDVTTLVDEPAMKVSLKAYAEKGCSYTAAPKNLVAAAKGGFFTIQIAGRGADCRSPTLLTSDSWLTAQVMSFNPATKRGTVKVMVVESESSAVRTGSLRIGDGAVSVKQTARPCYIKEVVPTSALVDRFGGLGFFTVYLTGLSAQDCGWTVTTDVGWIELGATGGQGSMEVYISIDENRTGRPRKGVVTVTLEKNKAVRKYMVVQQSM